VGYGGNLIWSGVIKEIHNKDKVKPVVCLKPKLSDLLCGRLYDYYKSLKNDPIFKNNPRVTFSAEGKNKKPLLSRLIDYMFSILLKIQSLNRLYETVVFNRSKSLFKNNGLRLIHIDLRIHSYALKQTRRRMIWKKGGHATQIISKNFGVECIDPDCELTFTKTELLNINRFIFKKKFGDYIVIDPNTNQDWFGKLRSWDYDCWQILIDKIIKNFPQIKILQIGLKGDQLLNNVIDIRGQTSFRQAALIIQKSIFFIGTEGGLMHAARAVKAKALIIWGGITVPEFAGYPNHHKIICKYVKCAPCGNLGWCDNDHICMKNIEVENVYEKAKAILNFTNKGKND